MSSDLAAYRALSWLEKALAMDYAPHFALHRAAEHYGLPAATLAELAFVKHVECSRARAERDTFAAADRELEAREQNPDRAALMVEARASGETLEEIGARFGLSRQRVQQVTGGRGTRSRIASPKRTKAIEQPKKSEAMRKVWAERRRSRGEA